MRSDDPDRAAILARRRQFILLALTGAAGPSSTACPMPCLSMDPPESDSDIDRDPMSDPVTTVCPAELGPPVSLLYDSQMRLPKGMTEEGLDELAPHFVRLSAPVELVSCIEGTPGGRIEYFAMAVFLDDPSKSMPEVRDEVLAALGYVDPSFSDEVNDEAARSYEVVFDSRDAANIDPARTLLRLTAHAGQIHAVVYEVHPGAWNALEASLRASMASLSFSP